MQAQAFEGVAQALSDPAVRRACRENPGRALATLRARGFDLPELGDEVEIKMVFNTADKLHWVLPIAFDDDSGRPIGAGKLRRVQAAGSTASTIASAGSAASLGSVCTTSSTASTASSAGTVGSLTD